MPQVIVRLQNWVVMVGFYDGRGWCWGQYPCTWCSSDWVVGHMFGWGIVGYMCEVTLVTLGGNAVGVSLGTLREGAEQSGWKTTASEGRGVLIAGAVGGLAVTMEKCETVFGWRQIDCRPALQTGLEWGVREPR